MNELEKLQRQYFEQEMTPSMGNGGAPLSQAVRPILRRWYIILLTFLIVGGGGAVAVWKYVPPMYKAVAAIQIKPVIPSILFHDEESQGVMPMYRNFMNTQAEFILGKDVLEDVADELVDKNLKLFQPRSVFLEKEPKKVNPFEVLSELVGGKEITTEPDEKSEFIKVSMIGSDEGEAKRVVDAIVNAYMNRRGFEADQGNDKKIGYLENEKAALLENIKRQREQIRTMAQEYGSSDTTSRQEIMLKRISSLQEQLTQIETQKMNLGLQLQLMQSKPQPGGLPEGFFERRQAYIRNDPTVLRLTETVAQLEQDLILAQQRLTKDNPELNQKEVLLEAFRTRLEERTEEVSKQFDAYLEQQKIESSSNDIARVEGELEQLKIQEQIIQKQLDSEDLQTRNLGRKQLDITEMQEQLALTKEMYDTIRRRIEELRMERNRPGRISVAYYATTMPVQTKRNQLTAAAAFGSFVLGVFFAFLLHKLDPSLRSPDDVVRCVGLPILGTTTPMSSDDKLLSEYLANDYQSIRSNLRLLTDGQIPKILIVTSSGAQEGKTTFSLNLATSLAGTGARVLLIDGDMRKPDIARSLGMKEISVSIEDMLVSGEEIPSHFVRTQVDGLEILPCRGGDFQLAVDEIAKPSGKHRIQQISHQYDHVIIDTPPVLAAPDALLWAKVGDAVVLSSMAGQTMGPELRETLDRLSKIDARVLGNVMGKVKWKDSYNYYGYSYYYGAGAKKSQRRKERPLLLTAKDS